MNTVRRILEIFLVVMTVWILAVACELLFGIVVLFGPKAPSIMRVAANYFSEEDHSSI